MEFIKYIAPFDYEQVVSLWQDVFSHSEALMEQKQIDGSESKYNTDIVYAAKENDKLIGAVHITIAKANPEIYGVSGVCTHPEARGRGIGRILFEKAMNDVDKMGCKAGFLGTGNPCAIKIYSSYGFSFIPCTGVMCRFADGNFYDYTRSIYCKDTEVFNCEEGSCDYRIPIIPLVICSCGETGFTDINVNLVRRGIYFSQVSCMGIFPRYLELVKKGGKYFGLKDEKGTLGAVCSVSPTEKGTRVDFFWTKNFDDGLRLLILQLQKQYDDIYFQIADSDKVKIVFAESLMFLKCEQELYSYDGVCLIPTTIYRMK